MADKIGVKTVEKATETNPGGQERTLDFDVDYGDTLEISIERYGEKLVHDYFFNTARLRVQGIARRMLQMGRGDAEVLEAVDKWVPGEISRGTGGKSEIAKLAERVKSGKMSKEELIALLSAELEEEDDDSDE